LAPSLTIAGYYITYLEPLFPYVFPEFIFGPIIRFINNEIPILAMLLKDALTFSFFKGILSALGYLFGFVLIRDYVYQQDLFTSSMEIYHDMSDLSSGVSKAVGDTVTAAQKKVTTETKPI